MKVLSQKDIKDLTPWSKIIHCSKSFNGCGATLEVDEHDIHGKYWDELWVSCPICNVSTGIRVPSHIFEQQEDRLFGEYGYFMTDGGKYVYNKNMHTQQSL